MNPGDTIKCYKCEKNTFVLKPPLRFSHASPYGGPPKITDGPPHGECTSCGAKAAVVFT